MRPASSDGPGQAVSPVQLLPLTTMVGHLIRRAQQVHTALWSAEFNGDLTGPQYGLLSVLSSQGGIDQSSAGRLAALDKSTAADVVARLQRNGWLSRHRGIPDGRQNLLVLTPAGRSALRDVTPRVIGIQRRLLEPLAPGDQQWFTDALAQVAYEGRVSTAPGPAASEPESPALPLSTTPGHLIRRTERLHRQRWESRIGRDLTPSQYDLLSVLAGHPAADQGMAGETASLDKSSTADIIARMARRGLVAVTRDERDRRRKLLTATSQASALLAAVTPAVETVQSDLMTSLSGSDASRLVSSLRQVAFR